MASYMEYTDTPNYSHDHALTALLTVNLYLLDHYG